MQIKQINTIAGYEGISDKYFIHNHGYVISVNDDGTRKILKGYENKRGSFYLILNQKALLISRLVALAFIPNPANKKEVNHIDGDKSNNHVNNLEWVTRQENMNRTGKHMWMKHVRPVCQFDENGVFIQKYESITEASIQTGIDDANIQSVCKGKLQTAGKYIWTYWEDRHSVKPLKYKNKNKTVLQYDLDGNFIMAHKSVKDAAASIGCKKQGVSSACNGQKTTYYGYIWKFEESSTTISQESTQQANGCGNGGHLM